MEPGSLAWPGFRNLSSFVVLQPWPGGALPQHFDGRRFHFGILDDKQVDFVEQVPAKQGEPKELTKDLTCGKAELPKTPLDPKPFPSCPGGHAAGERRDVEVRRCDLRHGLRDRVG